MHPEQYYMTCNRTGAADVPRGVLRGGQPVERDGEGEGPAPVRGFLCCREPARGFLGGEALGEAEKYVRDVGLVAGQVSAALRISPHHRR